MELTLLCSQTYKIQTFQNGSVCPSFIHPFFYPTDKKPITSECILSPHADQNYYQQINIEKKF